MVLPRTHPQYVIWKEVRVPPRQSSLVWPHSSRVVPIAAMPAFEFKSIDGIVAPARS